MSSEHLEEFEVTYDNINSHRKIRALPLSRRYIFRKTTGEELNDPPSLAFLKLKSFPLPKIISDLIGHLLIA